MLEGDPNPTIQSPEHNTASIMDENNMESVHLVDDSAQLEDDIQLVNPREIDGRKKRVCKGKKK